MPSEKADIYNRPDWAEPFEGEHVVKVECFADCPCGFHAEGSIEQVREAIKEHKEEIERSRGGTH